MFYTQANLTQTKTLVKTDSSSSQTGRPRRIWPHWLIPLLHNIWSRTPETRGEGYNAKTDWLTDSLSVAE